MKPEKQIRERLKEERGDAFASHFVAKGTARHVCVVLGLVFLVIAITTAASYCVGAPWITAVDDAIRARFFGGLSESAIKGLATFAWFGDIVATAIIAVVTLVVLIARKKKRLATIFLVSFITAEIFNFSVKAIVNRPRPEDALVVPPASDSFPSGHAFTAVILIGSIVVFLFACFDSTPLRTVLVILLLVYICLISADRILLGVHWPTDVIGGLAIGAAWLFFTMAAVLKPGPWYGEKYVQSLLFGKYQVQ